MYDDGVVGIVPFGDVKKVKGRLEFTHKSRVMVLGRHLTPPHFTPPEPHLIPCVYPFAG